MGLRAEIKQAKPFATPEQEALLGIERTAAVLGRAFAQLLEPHGLTPTQYNALRILRGAGDAGLCRYEVAERLVTPVPDVTRLLDRVEEAGYVTRTRDTADRRLVTARLTPAGRRLVDRLDAVVAGFERDHLGALGERDLRTLIALLDRVRQALASEPE